MGVCRPDGRHQAGHRAVPTVGRGRVGLDGLGADDVVTGTTPSHLQPELEGVRGGGDVHPPRKAVLRASSQIVGGLLNGITRIVGCEVLPGKGAAMYHLSTAREVAIYSPLVRKGEIDAVAFKSGIEQQTL